MFRLSSRAPLTLRRRFLLHNLLLVGGLVLAGAISVWRLGFVRGQVDLSRNLYAELRTISQVAVEVGTVRGLLTAPQPDREQIITHLTYATGGLDQFIEVGEGYGPNSDTVLRQAYVPINQAAGSARDRLKSVLAQLQHNPDASDPRHLRQDVDDAMRDVDRVASSCIRFMSGRQENASSELTRSVILIAGLFVLGVTLAVALGLLNHRLVMAPLQRLRRGVERVAAAEFTQRLEPVEMASSPEFLELGAEFNRMAGELDEFYRRLEEKVQTKGRELARSERLASVGFLAAGVAHEINNPLNIISGHAELTARQVQRQGLIPDEQSAGQVRQSLQIIRDEAFRCKEITEKLLSLARQGSDAREALDLCGVARDVVAMTKGLKDYRDRRLTVKFDEVDRLEVQANASEMKQVLLNLTINALEAAPPMQGEVCIEGRRTADWVELSITDNGRGMAADVLPHVFEPFFTSRKGSPNRGTGLGLSITHAIIESHGGRICAESDGPGRGARFIVRLPARPTRSALVLAGAGKGRG